MTEKQKAKKEKLKRRNERTRERMRKSDIRREQKKTDSSLPDVISSVSIIHSNKKKMSSKKCLEKHQREVQMKKDRENRERNPKVTIVKAKDI